MTRLTVTHPVPILQRAVGWGRRNHNRRCPIGTTRPDPIACLQPTPGWVLLRRPEIVDRFPGSRIHIPEKMVRQWTGFQGIVLAVGAPDPCNDPDGCLDDHDATGCHPVDPALIPGAWVLTNTGWSPTPDPAQFLVSHRNVTAVLCS